MFLKREVIGYTTSFLFHGALFLILSAVIMRPASYGIKAGFGDVEMDLVAAPKPQEAASVEKVLPEMPSPEKMPLPEPVNAKRPTEQHSQVPQKAVSSSGKNTVNQQVHAGGNAVSAKPDYLQNPAPPYPELAKSMRQEGIALLIVNVDREGNPTKIELEKSSGYTLLDQAALKAVSHWRFEPAKMGGLAIESKVEVPVRFRLDQ